MWLELFSVVAAIAVGLAVGAVILETPPKRKPRRARASALR
jgi:hypothetical protein